MNDTQTILVTGGAGFIGSHLVDHLLYAGHFVKVLDNLRNGTLLNLEQAGSSERFKLIKGDILDPTTCHEASAGCDVIYHLACLGVRHSLHSPIANHAVNATGTLNMLEAAQVNGCRQFLYISTSEIYGKVEQFPISETALPQPVTVYGASKLAGEHYALSYRERFGMNSVVLRIFNNYGPRAHYEGDSGEILPRSIVRALNGQAPIIFGDGSITRDFFYVKDTARALEGLMGRKDIAGQVFNIGTGVEISMKSLLQTTLDLMGTPLAIEYLEERPADVPRLWVDSAKFTLATGFKSAFSFEAGLLETIKYYKDLCLSGENLQKIPVKNWQGDER